MASSLLRSLAENQPFTVGNKRTAWAAPMVFLEINGVSVEAGVDDVVQMMLSVAEKELDVAGIAEFLEERAAHASALTLWREGKGHAKRVAWQPGKPFEVSPAFWIVPEGDSAPRFGGRDQCVSLDGEEHRLR
jgi:hypothetical protein